MNSSGVLSATISGAPFATSGDGNRNSKASEVLITPTKNFIVMSHNVSKQLESFAIQPDGIITPVSSVTLPDDPGNVAMHPNGQVFYASLGSLGSVAVVSLNPVTGQLALVNTVFVGSDVRDLDVHPTGRFLATGHMFGNENGVRLHALDGAGGILTPAIQSIAISGRIGKTVQYGRGGFVLFVLDLDAGVYTFLVDQVTGILDRVINSPFSVGGFASKMAVHPGGEFCYVVKPGTSATTEVATFRVEANATLTTVPGSPFLFPQGDFQHLGFDATGSRLYFTGRSSLNALATSVSSVTGSIAPIGQAQIVPGASVTPKMVPGAFAILE